MSTFRHGALWIVITLFVFLCAGVSSADGPVRGLVVDNGDKTIWLGLPYAVEPGTVFTVSLVPGSEILARATVIEITAEPPFVAKASVKLVRKDAFIPVGAYVEVTSDGIPMTDEPEGYDSVDFHEETARRLTLRAGAFFPTSGNLKDEIASVWPMVQLSYQICNKQKMDTQVGLAYYGQNGSFSEGVLDGTREFRVVPLTIDIRIPMSYSRTGGWFARAGVGAYFIRDRRTLDSDTTSKDVVTFGWQAGFGYATRRGQSLEVYYTDVSKTDFRGLVFSLGTHF